jgi:CIC family chloride channel protein
MAQTRGIPVKAFWIFLLAASVGGLGGLLSVGFQKLLGLLQVLAMGGSTTSRMSDIAETLDPLQRLLVPTAGGLAAALLLATIKGQRWPFGITDIIELIATRKGVIRPLHALVQVLSSACAIATGASIGKEGPNSHLAATVGAVLSRAGKLDARTRSVLLGCGVAAGMSCAYSAPIAGALFVMEVVLGNFAMDIFAPIVVSSVCATLVQRGFLGEWTLLARNETLDTALTLSAIGLGAMCGLGSLVFQRALLFGGVAFGKTRMPLLVTMPLGGLLIGIIGIWRPDVWGNGIGVLEKLTTAGLATPATAVAALLLLKIVGTAISTGSGALGGVFTPNLVVGAALGSAFGSFVHLIAPSSGDHRVAFALVGMAGLCAATTHAPIAAVLLVFEMTRDYGLMLPLMLCSIIGSVTARLLSRDSIYTARLRARGHHTGAGIEELAMQQTFVRDLSQRDQAVVRDTDTFDQVIEKFTSARRDSVFVVDGAGLLLGHIHIHDVKFYVNDPTLSSLVIAGDLSRPTPMVTPDESLAQVLPRFDDPELDEIAVVDAYATRRLLGRVTRRDVIACLSDEVLRTRQLRAKVRADGQQGASYVELPPDSEIGRVPLSTDFDGRALDSLELDTYGVIPLFVVRTLPDGTKTRELVTPATVLAAPCELMVLGPRAKLAALANGHGPGRSAAT